MPQCLSSAIYPPPIHTHTHTRTLLCQSLFPRGQRESHSTAQATPQCVSIGGTAFALEKSTYFACNPLALCVKELICSHYQAHEFILRVSKQRELFTSTTVSHFVFLGHQHRSKILNNESVSFWTLQRLVEPDCV